MNKLLGVQKGYITLNYKTYFPVKLISGNSEISTNALITRTIMEDYHEKEINSMIMNNIKN